MDKLTPEQVTIVELAAELYAHVVPGKGETRGALAVTEALSIVRDVKARSTGQDNG